MLDIRIIFGESVTDRFRDGKPVPYKGLAPQARDFHPGEALGAPAPVRTIPVFLARQTAKIPPRVRERLYKHILPL